MLKLRDLAEIHGLSMRTLIGHCKRLGFGIKTITDSEMAQLMAIIYPLYPSRQKKPKQAIDPNIHVAVWGEDVFVGRTAY